MDIDPFCMAGHGCGPDPGSGLSFTAAGFCYALGCAALMAMVILPAMTFSMLESPSNAYHLLTNNASSTAGPSAMRMNP
jgi:hypothetical protein